ncbi:MAG: nucleoside triphosphate pyrophosphohydrolase [Peptococcaceae bacterium]|nr:nucleoside triphosphate pyrophosphohydrolase [Peptococcaceae bacterium]
MFLESDKRGSEERGSEERPPLEKLKMLMAHLRSEKGCPWDREQTHSSLKKYLLEETYEVLQAIDEENVYNLREELGDLLLQVVFHAQIAEEEGDFTLEDIIEKLVEKLLRRHPHVFGDTDLGGDGINSGNAGSGAGSGGDGSGGADGAETPLSVAEVHKTWERIKRREKQQRADNGGSKDETVYLQVPKGLPALMYAEGVQRKASQWGFDWPDRGGPWRKVHEEIGELAQAMEGGSQEDLCNEMGDILFSLVNVCRFIDVDPEESLRRSVRKFQMRFTEMIKIINVSEKKIENISLEELDEVWNRVKDGS